MQLLLGIHNCIHLLYYRHISAELEIACGTRSKLEFLLSTLQLNSPFLGRVELSMPQSLASIYRIICLFQSGYINNGAAVIYSFRASKDHRQSSVHLNLAFFLVKFIKGIAIQKNPEINLLFPMIPMNPFTFLTD